MIDDVFFWAFVLSMLYLVYHFIVEEKLAKRWLESKNALADLQSLEQTEKIFPPCPICGNNRQVWVNQLSGLITCHRAGCNQPIEKPIEKPKEEDSNEEG